MVVDLSDVAPFLTWLPSALLEWMLVVACLAVGITVVAWIITALLHGPVSAMRKIGRVLRDAVGDLIHISPRRVCALARLAIKESIRRRVVVVFVVFVLILLFAGWFLDLKSLDPARLYLNFVLTATSYLVLLLALFLSSLSLPADIKNRTLQTVATKPVRASEIVLGRIVGFTAVATFLLVLMGLVSYVFVERGIAYIERTREDLPPDREMLLARVPVYGKLVFQDRKGEPIKGVNVGDEWTYRSYVAGGTLASAVWTFQNVSEEAFPDGLPVEMTLGIFRTHKGEIEKGVPGSLSVRNPKTGKTVEVRIFEGKEFTTDVQNIPRELRTPEGKKLDLFKDIVSDGQVEVLLQCAAPGQYFGVAQADLYLRARDASFPLNFTKGYIGIWLQTLLVVSLGVMYSTFLSGPVAMLATLGTLLGGFFHDFMFRLATGQTYGGGPFESVIRILTQQNVTSEPEDSLRSTVAQTLDQAAEFGLRMLAAILPDFGRFSFSEFVASGFNIPGDTLLTYTCRAFGFVLPVFVAGYLCLKNRELAQ